MLSKLSRRTVLIAALVVAIASVSAVAVAAAHHSGHAAHHHQFGAAGWVTDNSGSTLTLRDGRARAHTFDTPSTTKFVYQDGSAATSADAKPGTVVSVRATKPTTGGNPVAKRVVIHLAHLAGLVQSNTGGVITIHDAQGFTRSINTSGATCSQGGSTVACSSIAQNSVVVAKGKVDPDGTTLDATRVRSRAPH